MNIRKLLRPGVVAPLVALAAIATLLLGDQPGWACAVMVAYFVATRGQLTRWPLLWRPLITITLLCVPVLWTLWHKGWSNADLYVELLAYGVLAGTIVAEADFPSPLRAWYVQARRLWADRRKAAGE